MIALLWLACAQGPVDVEVRVVPGGFDVRADAPLASVEVIDAAGAPVARRRLPAASEDVWLDAAWTPGAAYRVRADGEAGGAVEVDVVAPADLGPVRLAVEAPLGQDARDVADGERIPVVVVVGAAVEVGVVATAVIPGEVTVRFGEGPPQAWTLAVPGERRVARAQLTGDLPVEVTWPGGGARFVLDPVLLGRDEAAERLALVSVVFPSEPTGQPDLARSPGRVTLPARWWEATLRRLDLGFRPADHQAPWGLAAVALANRGPDALNVVVESRVVDGSGRPVAAFRPRLRESDGGIDHVTTLLRVPAQSGATTIVPVFVDRGEVLEGAYVHEVSVTPLGSAEPLHVVRQPIAVVRGSTWASFGVVGSAAAAAVGLLWLAARLPGWLRAWPTSDLTTIALFGSLQLVVGLAAQLVATVTTAIIGPFSPLLTGIVDDAFRAALLVVLITLLPRPGTASLSLVVGYLLRVLALGTFTPLDPIYVGASVVWLEGALWLTGVTRATGWRSASWTRRWLRLSLALGASSVLGAITALSVHVWFYRLFYADWYVAAVLALPSFVYVVVSTGLAIGFADALRRVES